MKTTGWLLDLYDQPGEGLVLWLITETGQRLRLHQPFPVTFYAAGPEPRLRALQLYLKSRPQKISLQREEQRDLFQPQPVKVLAVRVEQTAEQPILFRRISNQFPDLDYYNADIQPFLRYSALYGTFALAHCHVDCQPDGLLTDLQVLDTPWDLDPEPAPLRVLQLKPDCEPQHAPPTELIAVFEGHEYHLALFPERPLLINLQAILQRHDPDLILSAAGDTWLLPMLIQLSTKLKIPIPLNREPARGVLYKKEGTFFSYGQIIYRGQQVHLFGRCHIDGHNAMMWQDYDLDGALETARITGLPLQVAARVSPGTGISSMQITTALRSRILVPWRKQQAERDKTALDLLRYDQGGLVYQPITGLHFDVGMVDFISMYPSIMVRSNISPETPMPTELGHSDHPPGLIPRTLAPLLEKRVGLKQRALALPRWDPRRRKDKSRSAAHKWLLVTCFGYLGYKNARFGRIEAHEAVTTWGREALLRAKEAAERLGFTVLHMYVDGLWVKKPGCRQPLDFQQLLDDIVRDTSLPVALDGVYRWVAFLPSRVDERLPVPNRYFGVFQDGSTKVRGIELRRRDSAPFIAQVQTELLDCLAQAQAAGDLPVKINQAVAILKVRLQDLYSGKISPSMLVVGKKLSKELAGYRVPSHGARAVLQLLAAGKMVRPGQRVRLLYTRGEPGVFAWDLPGQLNPDELNLDYYQRLLLRAASAVLQPFGIEEDELENLVIADRGTQNSLWEIERDGVLPLISKIGASI
jgi:DNA polymerase-2